LLGGGVKQFLEAPGPSVATSLLQRSGTGTTLKQIRPKQEVSVNEKMKKILLKSTDNFIKVIKSKKYPSLNKQLIKLLSYNSFKNLHAYKHKLYNRQKSRGIFGTTFSRPKI